MANRAAGRSWPALTLWRSIWLAPSIATILIALAAVMRDLRPVVLVVLVVAVVLTSWRWPGSIAAWSAVVPVAIILTWRASAATPIPVAADCTNPLAPMAASRATEAALVLCVVAALAYRLSSSRRELGLRAPHRAAVLLGSAGFAAVLLAAVVGGDVVTRGLYGEIRLALPLAALAPALVFALSNSLLEEVVYRGAMRAWFARSIGVAAAIAAQALIFGLAHLGPGVTGAVVPLVVTMTGVGLVGGLVTVRTGSLFAPIATHVAADIALYYVEACRVG